VTGDVSAMICVRMQGLMFCFFFPREKAVFVNAFFVFSLVEAPSAHFKAC
jgi:hypothetical protein